MAEFALYDHTTWDPWHYLAFGGTIVGGMELLTHLVPLVFEGTTQKIEMRGKHYEVLGMDDIFCINFNKIVTAFFVYHTLNYCWTADNVEWDMSKITVFNTLGSLLAFYVFYDFIYTLFHWALHHPSIYKWIHKHHHKQKAPSRGNVDAINVHPIEFGLGEYLHLLAAYCIPSHIVAVTFFILFGGILASLNHTRFDVIIPGFFSVKNHDIHHRDLEVNFGQYTVWWDRIFGVYRHYDDEPIKKKR